MKKSEIKTSLVWKSKRDLRILLASYRLAVKVATFSSDHVFHFSFLSFNFSKVNSRNSFLFDDISEFFVLNHNLKISQYGFRFINFCLCNQILNRGDISSKFSSVCTNCARTAIYSCPNVLTRLNSTPINTE